MKLPSKNRYSYKSGLTIEYSDEMLIYHYEQII